QIFMHYSEAAGKLAQGTVTAGVADELREVLAMQQQLQAKLPADSLDWHDLEEQRAYVTESVARACQILRQAPEAIESYQDALRIWHGLGEHDQEARCITKLTDVELLEHADLDRVRGVLVAAADRDLNRADPAALTRAQALTSLAALYIQAHDDTQARQRLSEATSWLKELRFVDPREAGLEPAFIAWMREAPGPAAGFPADQRFLCVV